MGLFCQDFFVRTFYIRTFYVRTRCVRTLYVMTFFVAPYLALVHSGCLLSMRWHWSALIWCLKDSWHFSLPAKHHSASKSCHLSSRQYLKKLTCNILVLVMDWRWLGLIPQPLSFGATVIATVPQKIFALSLLTWNQSSGAFTNLARALINNSWVYFLWKATGPERDERAQDWENAFR